MAPTHCYTLFTVSLEFLKIFEVFNKLKLDLDILYDLKLNL